MRQPTSESTETFRKNLCCSRALFGGPTFGLGESGAGVVGTGETLEVFLGSGLGCVERGVLGPGQDLGVACALDDTVVDLWVEALIAAEIGEEISPAQAFVTEHIAAFRAGTDQLQFFPSLTFTRPFTRRHV